MSRHHWRSVIHGFFRNRGGLWQSHRGGGKYRSRYRDWKDKPDDFIGVEDITTPLLQQIEKFGKWLSVAILL
jgi:hypothetical protein